MRKFVIIVALGVTLILGLTLSAAALTINNAPSGELNLYEVFNGFGLLPTLSSNAQLITTYPTVLQNLSTDPGIPGFYWEYALSGYYASYAGFTQDPGTNPQGSPTPKSYFHDLVGSPFPTPPNLNQIKMIGPLVFTPSTDASGNFGFFDETVGGGTKYTEKSLNNTFGQPYPQSNGLIFQVDSTNQFIVCFEDGDAGQPLGDMDYQDLVLEITRTLKVIPIPPSAVLLGSGLLGMAGLGWWRRKK
jgi:hypothetical protein